MSIKFVTTNVEITITFMTISGAIYCAILNIFLWSQVSFEREGEGGGVGWGGVGVGEAGVDVLFCFWFLLEDVRSRLRMSIM